MLDFDRFRELLATLRRNALRTLLTAVGVFWGVFLLVVMVGFGNGLEQGTRGGMMGTAANSLYVWGERTSRAFAGLSPGRYVRLTLEDARAVATQPGVAVVAPRASLGGRGGAPAVSRQGKSGTFTVMGDTPALRQVQPMTVRGRFLNELDMRERRKVVVIGRRVVELLFRRGEEPIGETVKIQGLDFLVVGVFATEATGDRGARDAATLFTPLTTYQRSLSRSEKVDYLAVLSADDVRASAIEGPLLERLRQRHRVAPDDQQAIGSFNLDAEYQKIVNLFRGISLLVYLVGSATLAAGLVGVSNIMMVSVRERTREIGIRKAVGATPRAVIGQIVLEAVALASAAGYLGLVIGVGLLELVGVLFFTDRPNPGTLFTAPAISLATAAVAAVAVAFGGALAGLFPALHAARIRTVTALRDE